MEKISLRLGYLVASRFGDMTGDVSKTHKLSQPPEEISSRTGENNNLFKSWGDITTEVNKP
jgi:hypothetical protein